jgi:hypothetical protein
LEEEKVHFKITEVLKEEMTIEIHLPEIKEIIKLTNQII